MGKAFIYLNWPTLLQQCLWTSNVWARLTLHTARLRAPTFSSFPSSWCVQQQQRWYRRWCWWSAGVHRRLSHLHTIISNNNLVNNNAPSDGSNTVHDCLALNVVLMCMCYESWLVSIVGRLGRGNGLGYYGIVYIADWLDMPWWWWWWLLPKLTVQPKRDDLMNVNSKAVVVGCLSFFADLNWYYKINQNKSNVISFKICMFFVLHID